MSGPSAVESRGACPDRGTLVAFNSGRLTDPEMERLAEHVGTCDRCERTLQELLHRPADSFEAKLLRFCAELSSKATDTRQGSAAEVRCDADTQTDDGRGPQPDTQAETPEVRMLGPYSLREVLGRGGMGIVYRAVHTVLNRTIALKTLHPGWERRGETFVRFRREGEVIARLIHPNIVRIYDFNESDGVPYLSMELVEGETLARRLDRGPLPFREAAELVRTLSLAVEYAHEQKVVHRDLKPLNVLMSRDGALKVTDFGLAKVLDEGRERLTHTDAVMGTPSYMAPEQAAGRTADIGPRTDVYALGAILYESLTGVPPYLGDSKLKTLNLVQEGNLVPPSRRRPDIPSDLEAVCLKCLAASPADRFPSAEALAGELARWLSGERTQTRPPGAFRRLVQRVGKRKRQVAACALAAGLLGGVAAFPPWNPTPTAKKAAKVTEPVPIRKPDGTLLPFRIVHGAGTSEATADADGTITVHAAGLCLVEYTPDVKEAPAQFQASARHIRGDLGSFAGVYFAHRSAPGTDGPTHAFCMMVYDDLRSAADTFKGRPLPSGSPPSPNGSVRIECKVLVAREDRHFPFSQEMVPRFPFPVCGLRGDCWRDLAIDLTRDGITGKWDKQRVGSVSATALTNAFTNKLKNARDSNPGDEKLAAVAGDYNAAGGFGLVVDRGSACFNRIKVIPVGKAD